MRNPADIIHCLDSHMADLQPPCAAKVENITKMMDKFHSSCDAHLNNICPDAINDPRKIHACVIENLASLSSGCLQTISDIAKEAHENRGPRGDGAPDMGVSYLDEFAMLGSMDTAQPFDQLDQSASAEEEYGDEYYSEPNSRDGSNERAPLGHVAGAAVLAGGCGALLILGIAFVVNKYYFKAKGASGGVAMGSPLMMDAAPQGMA